MTKSLVFLLLAGLLLALVFFWGKREGAFETKVSIVQNIEMVRQVAELASLEVNGSTNVKVSNAGNVNDLWGRFKDYFWENTIHVSVPFTAKYGVDLANQKMDVTTRDTSVVITLPPGKLLSLQLRLDELEVMNQNGLFVKTTAADLKDAQKQLYQQALKNLSAQQGLILQAQKHISDILIKYYAPLGYHVQCIFAGDTNNNLKQ